jgi:hypothetical protein
MTFCTGGSSAGLLGFSFSPITNQSNDRLFLAGIAGEKWMLGFRTAILVQDLVGTAGVLQPAVLFGADQFI